MSRRRLLPLHTAEPDADGTRPTHDSITAPTYPTDGSARRRAACARQAQRCPRSIRRTRTTGGCATSAMRTTCCSGSLDHARSRGDQAAPRSVPARDLKLELSEAKTLHHPCANGSRSLPRLRRRGLQRSRPPPTTARWRHDARRIRQHRAARPQGRDPRQESPLPTARQSETPGGTGNDSDVTIVAQYANGIAASCSTTGWLPTSPPSIGCAGSCSSRSSRRSPTNIRRAWRRSAAAIRPPSRPNEVHGRPSRPPWNGKGKPPLVATWGATLRSGHERGPRRRATADPVPENHDRQLLTHPLPPQARSRPAEPAASSRNEVCPQRRSWVHRARRARYARA